MSKLVVSLILALFSASAYGQSPADSLRQTAPASAEDILPASAEDILIDAVQSFGDADFSKAKDQLVLALEADSTLDAAYYYLGLVGYAQKDLRGALDNMKKAWSLDSSNTSYLEAQASLHNALGETDKANDIYITLLESYPKKYRNAFTLSLLADQQMAEGKDSLALDSYGQALLYDPDYVPAKLGQAEVYMVRGQHKESFEAVEQVLRTPEILPGPKIQYVTNICRSLTQEQWQLWKSDLMGLAASLCETHPESVEAINFEVQLNYVYQDAEGAIASLSRVLNVPGVETAAKVEALGNIGDLQHQLGNEEACFEAYERALAMNPDYSPVLNNYAYFLALKSRKLHKALKMSAKTIAAEPDNATYLDTYGWLLFLVGRAKEAKPVLKNAIIYGGAQSDELLAHYARVLEALGEKDLAAYYYNQIKNRK